jgi:transcriptional regulator with XRE-family HTH domain
MKKKIVSKSVKKVGKRAVGKKAAGKTVKAKQHPLRRLAHPLKQWLLAHPKIRQRDFAKSVGSSQAHISQVSNRTAGLSAKLAQRIAKKTKIALSKLL